MNLPTDGHIAGGHIADGHIAYGHIADGHIAVVDLGFGDAGKGTIVDWLCASRPVHAVVRFNGGAQAGHNVVVPGVGSHTFSQFGAGTLRGVPTFLSRFMVVDPLSLTFEASHLATLGVADPYRLLTVDRQALVATPYHRLANQARETARGPARHGSCGMGVGETVAYALDHPATALRFGDLSSPATMARKIATVADWLRDRFGALDDLPPIDLPPIDDLIEVYGLVAARVKSTDDADAVLRGGPCVFEGAQGVLLDEWRGFHPYTTWSTTTFDNVDTLTRGAYRLGVLRSYTTRHGVGPMVTEDAALTRDLVDPHNRTGPWQGPFRVGHFDAVAHRYAVEVAGGVDGVALTHLDVAARRTDLRWCGAYDIAARLEPGPHRDLDYQEKLTQQLFDARPILDDRPVDDWPAAVADVIGAPVVVRSCGPTAADKHP